eukprot:9325534-Prorocentrum_lima.AAC.1
MPRGVVPILLHSALARRDASAGRLLLLVERDGHGQFVADVAGIAVPGQVVGDARLQRRPPPRALVYLRDRFVQDLQLLAHLLAILAVADADHLDGHEMLREQIVAL